MPLAFVGSREDLRVLARRREAPRALFVGGLAVVARDHRALETVAPFELAKHRRQLRLEPRARVDRQRHQPIEHVPTEIAMADLVAQDAIERPLRAWLGAPLAKMFEERYGNGLAETKCSNVGDEQVALERLEARGASGSPSATSTSWLMRE